MRKEFIKNLIIKRKKDKSIFLLTGDLGYSVLEEFRDKFKSSFINVGIAEQNMVGLATGLSLENNKIYIYSINNFLAFRALEQIRNDICYHNLDVKIVTVGSGFDYGTAGYSHFGIEDIAIMRSLPNLEIYCPADSNQLNFLFSEINDFKKPLYLRLGKVESKSFTNKIALNDYNKKKYFEIYKSKKINFLCFGTIAFEAYQACKYLREELNISIGLITIPKINNTKNKYLSKLITSSNIIICLEEHINHNGFGSFILENYYNKIKNIKFFKIGVSKRFESIGSQFYMRKINKIDKNSIIKFVKKLI